LHAGSLVRSIAAAIVAGGIVVLGATTAGAVGMSLRAATDWPQYQGNPQHTGDAVSAPSAPFRVAWTHPTGIGDETHFAGIPAPVVVDGNAIVVDREDVAALTLTSGAVAWTIERRLGPSAPAAVTPRPGGTTLLFTEGGGDRSSSAGGTPTPSPTSSVSGSPTTSAAERSTLVAVDAETRKVLWRRELPDVSIGGPTVDGSTVLVGTDDGSVTAVALGTGDQEWSVDLGESVDTPIAAADGTAYVAVSGTSGQAPAVVSLREADGSDVWRFEPAGPGLSIGAPALADGTVYVAVSDASIRALDAASGQPRWAAKLNLNTGGGAPAVSDDSVVVADIRGEVYRFAPSSGERLWDFAMNTPVYGSTVIAGSSVVVADSDGDVSAIDLESGRRVWRQNVGEGLILGLAVALDTIVASRTGPAAGLVGLINDPSGALIDEQSPTIVEPVDLGAAWAIAAVPLVAILILAGRFLEPRLGPSSFAAEEDDRSEDPEGDDLP